MGCELLLTPYHIKILIQRLVGKKVGRLEDPCAIRANPLLGLVIPDQFAIYRHIQSPKQSPGDPGNIVRVSFQVGLNFLHSDDGTPTLQNESWPITGL